MALKIEAPEAIAVPAKPEQTFTQLSLRSMNVARRGAELSLAMTFLPYDPDTQQMGDTITKLIIPDVFTEAARVPALGGVMAGICTLSSRMIKERLLASKFATASANVAAATNAKAEAADTLTAATAAAAAAESDEDKATTAAAVTAATTALATATAALTDAEAAKAELVAPLAAVRTSLGMSS